MVTSLPSAPKAVLPTGLFIKPQAGDLEALQDLSFGELLKAKEKQLQHEQEVNSASVAAALATLQLNNLPVPTSASRIETGLGNGSALRPAAQAAEAGPVALSQPWTTSPVTWAETGPETLATPPQATGEALTPTASQAETAPAVLPQLPPSRPTAAALTVAGGVAPEAVPSVLVTVLPAETVSSNPGVPVNIPVETPSQPTAIPVSPKPATDPKSAVSPASNNTPVTAASMPATVSPAEVSIKTPDGQATAPVATSSQPVTAAARQRPAVDPKNAALPASKNTPVAAAPASADVSPASVATKNSNVQATITDEPVSQPLTVSTPQKPDVEPKSPAASVNRNMPVVAAPTPETVSPASVATKNPSVQATVTDEPVSQPVTVPTPQKSDVEPKSVASPVNRNTPVAAAPIPADVSLASVATEKPSVQAMVTDEPVSQPVTLPTPRTPDVDPKVVASPANRNTPVAATPIPETVSSASVATKNPNVQVAVTDEPVSPLVTVPTPQKADVDPKIVAASPANRNTPVAAAPIPETVSPASVATKNSNVQATITGQPVSQPVTVPTPQESDVEPKSPASPANRNTPVAAAPIPETVSPASVAKNSNVQATVTDEPVSQSVTVPTPQKLDVDQKVVASPANRNVPVAAAPIPETVSSASMVTKNPSVQATVTDEPVRRPVTVPTPQKPEVEPQSAASPANRNTPVVAAPSPAAVSPASVATKNPSVQATVTAEPVSQPVTMPTPQKPDIDQKVVAAPVNRNTPVVAAPSPAAVSPASVATDNSSVQAPVTDEPVSQSVTMLTSQKPDVEQKVVAAPANRNTSVAVAPMSAQVSPTPIIYEKPGASVTTPVATVSQSPVSPEPEQPGLELKMMAASAGNVPPVVAAAVPLTALPAEAPAGKTGTPVALPVETASQPSASTISKKTEVELNPAVSPARENQPGVAPSAPAMVSPAEVVVPKADAPVTLSAEPASRPSTLPALGKNETDPQLEVSLERGTSPAVAASVSLASLEMNPSAENPDVKVTLPTESTSQPAVLPASAKPSAPAIVQFESTSQPAIMSTSAKMGVEPESVSTPFAATSTFATVSPADVTAPSPRTQVTVPAGTASQPSTLTVSEPVDLQPQGEPLPANGTVSAIPPRVFPAVSPVSVAEEHSRVQTAVSVENSRQPVISTVLDQPELELQPVALPASGTRPVVAAPMPATGSPADGMAKNPGTQVSVPAEMASQPAASAAPEKVEVKPTAGQTPVAETPIATKVSPTAAVDAKPRASVTLPAETDSQPVTAPIREKMTIEPQNVAASASESAPVAATSTLTPASPVDVPVETPAAQVAISVETASQPVTWPTSEKIVPEPQSVAESASESTPVAVTPTLAPASPVDAPAETSAAQVTVPAETASRPVTLLTPEKMAIEHQSVAVSASESKPAVATSTLTPASPVDAPAETPAAQVTVPAETVSRPVTWPTPEKIGIEPQSVAASLSESTPVTATPTLTPASPADVPVENLGAQVRGPVEATVQPEKVEGEPRGVNRVSNSFAQVKLVEPPKTVEAPSASTTQVTETPPSAGVLPAASVASVPSPQAPVLPAEPAPALSEFGTSLGQSPVEGESAATGPEVTHPVAQVAPGVAPVTIASAGTVKAPAGSPVGQAEAAKIPFETARSTEKQPEINPRPEALPAAPQPVSEVVTLQVTGKELTIQASEIIRQIAPQLHARIQSGPTTLRLQLNPRELGAIEVQMVTGPRGVSVTFFAEQTSTGRLLETQMNQLRQSMTEAGIQLSDLQIGQQGQPRQEGGAFNQHSQFAQTAQPQAVPGEVKLQETQNPVRTPGRWSEVDYLA